MRSQSLDRVYQQIKQKIIDGDYVPAQRLVETTLARELNVGRYKIRAVLERLQADGLVQIEPNRGATVTTLELDEVLDILVAREALEAGVAYLAAQRIDQDQIQRLSECLDIMRDALASGKYEQYSATNKLFHQTVYEASGNQTMPALIQALRQRLARLQLRAILIPGRREHSLGEHEAILQALQAGDAVAAERAARAHMRSLTSAIADAWQLIRV